MKDLLHFNIVEGMILVSNSGKKLHVDQVECVENTTIITGTETPKGKGKTKDKKVLKFSNADFVRVENRVNNS